MKAGTKVANVVFVTDDNGLSGIELHFEDGSAVTYELNSSFTRMELDKIPNEVAKLIRDYAKGKITIDHVRETLGLDPSKAEREFFEKFDGRLEEYLQRAFGPMLEMLKEMTEVTQQEEEFDAPEEAFPGDPAMNSYNQVFNNLVDSGEVQLSAGSINEPTKQIYMTIPMETPPTQVFVIVQMLEDSGYPYTINKE